MMTAMVRLCSNQYCERERTFSIETRFIYCIKVEKHRPLKLELVAHLSTGHGNRITSSHSQQVPYRRRCNFSYRKIWPKKALTETTTDWNKILLQNQDCTNVDMNSLILAVAAPA